MRAQSRGDAFAELIVLCDAPDQSFDLTAVSIACALHDDPVRPLDESMSTLSDMSMGARALKGDPALALPALMHHRLGFAGDTKTYDDLTNADIISVLSHRKGLPVSLGILYRHVARQAGISLFGVDTPGHFIMRLDQQDTVTFLDVFADGKILELAELQRLVPRNKGSIFDLEMLRAMPDRRIALRLQNNVWARTVQAGQWEHAERVASRRCVLFEAAPLKFDHAVALANLGSIKGARVALDDARALKPIESLAIEIDALDTRLRRQLH